MGFQRSALLLEWPEGSEFAGLEVRMRRMSIDQLLRVQRLSDLGKGADGAVMSSFAELLDAVGDGLLGWNYETEVKAEDGTILTVPVPATRAALGGVDIDMVLALVRAWTQAAAAVPLASAPSSPNGAPALPPEPPDELAGWLAYQETNPASSPEPALS